MDGVQGAEPQQLITFKIAVLSNRDSDSSLEILTAPIGLFRWILSTAHSPKEKFIEQSIV